jgi:glycosyltransferase involved in cell wall biosynthesis
MTSTFYPPYHLGGDAVHVKYLAEELVKRGHEVHVLHSLDAYRVKRKSLPEKAEINGVHIHTIKTRFNLSSYMAYVFGNSSPILRKFEELVKEVKPDVVHNHNISLLGYGLLKKRGNYLNLYTAHDYWLICQQNNLLKNGSEICDDGSCFLCSLKCGKPPQLWRHGKEFRESVENIDILIAPSNYVKDKISEKFNVKAVTIPNFVPEPPSYIEPSGFSNFFLYAGVLEKHKGITTLIDVYKEISGEIDAKLLIVGAGNLRDKIKEYIKRNGLETKIALLGWLDHSLLYRLLKDANALIMPSLGPENCPLIALEALSLGTPIVASDKGGLPEIARKIDKDLIYNSSDQLKKILLNFNKNSYSSSSIKAIYERYYSPEVYLKSYLKIIS